jgi:SAM-dependent methyltransferase
MGVKRTQAPADPSARYPIYSPHFSRCRLPSAPNSGSVREDEQNRKKSPMADPEQINADMLSFWNGVGGRIWVERQAHTDITLTPMTEALLAFAAPRAGERVLDVGCGCGATTLEFARAVGPTGRVAALDISGPMLAEGESRAKAEGLANIDWHEADAATAALDRYDLLTSAFGTMFFGDPVAAFANMRRAAKPGARMALVCWRTLAENPWMEVPMNAVAPHLPPRPKGVPNAPGMFAFADPQRVSEVLTASGWAPPRLDKLDLNLDIAAGRGLEQAVVQSTQIGAVNSWLRNQPAEIVTAATASMREALAAHQDGANVRLPGAMWLISSATA